MPYTIHSERRSDASSPPRLHSGSLAGVGGSRADFTVLDNPLFESDVVQPLAGPLPIMPSSLDSDELGAVAKRMGGYGEARSIEPVQSVESFSTGRDAPGWDSLPDCCLPGPLYNKCTGGSWGKRF